jgi:hypothetical protein
VIQRRRAAEYGSGSGLGSGSGSGSGSGRGSGSGSPAISMQSARSSSSITSSRSSKQMSIARTSQRTSSVVTTRSYSSQSMPRMTKSSPGISGESSSLEPRSSSSASTKKSPVNGEELRFSTVRSASSSTAQPAATSAIPTVASASEAYRRSERSLVFMLCPRHDRGTRRNLGKSSSACVGACRLRAIAAVERTPLSSERRVEGLHRAAASSRVGDEPRTHDPIDPRIGGLMRTFIALLATLLVGGCAQTAMFRAAEKATAVSPRGAIAAEYDLRARDRDLGEVKVWSNGAYREEAYGEEHVVVHVAFEIENGADTPIALDTDRLVLSSKVEGMGRVDNQYADRVRGVTEVEPRETRRIDAYFFMPRGVDPEDVVSFRVDWRLERSPGAATLFAERTPFLEDPYAYWTAPYSGYPYAYAPWPYAFPYYGYGI